MAAASCGPSGTCNFPLGFSLVFSPIERRGVKKLFGLVQLTGDIRAMSACNRPGNLALKMALISSVAFAFVVAVADPADAAIRSRVRSAGDTAKRPNPERDGFQAAKGGVLQIVVSIGSQRVTLFSDGYGWRKDRSRPARRAIRPLWACSALFRRTAITTRIFMAMRPCTTCSASPGRAVPCMRALLPGRAASHGCIRLSHGFAAATVADHQARRSRDRHT